MNHSQPKNLVVQQAWHTMALPGLWGDAGGASGRGAEHGGVAPSPSTHAGVPQEIFAPLAPWILCCILLVVNEAPEEPKAAAGIFSPLWKCLLSILSHVCVGAKPAGELLARH